MLIYGHSRSIKGLNASYSGATLLHSHNVFMNKIVPLRLSAVVLMSGFVDTHVGKLQKPYWSDDCSLVPVIDVEASNTSRDTRYLAQPDYSDRFRPRFG